MAINPPSNGVHADILNIKDDIREIKQDLKELSNRVNDQHNERLSLWRARDAEIAALRTEQALHVSNLRAQQAVELNKIQKDQAVLETRIYTIAGAIGVVWSAIIVGVVKFL